MNELLSKQHSFACIVKRGVLAFAVACIACVLLLFPSAAQAQPAAEGKAPSGQTVTTSSGALHIFAFNNCDAILVESNGLFGMIDSGEDSDYPSGDDPRYPLRAGITIGHGREDQVIRYLKSKGVNSSNFVFYIGTHAHSDHIGTADEVIREFKPKYVYTPLYDDSYITNSSHLWDNQYVYDRMLAAATDVGAQIIQQPTEEQRTFTLGGLTLQICNYREITDDFRTDDANDYSWGVKVSDGRSTAFLAGDINNVLGSEDRLAGEVGKVDLLKMGHHGHVNSSTPSFLSALSPDVAVLTGNKQVVADSILRQLFSEKSDLITAADATAQDWEAIVCTFTSQGIAYNVKRDTSGIRYFVFNASPYVVAHRDFTPVVSNGWGQNGDVWYWFDNSSTATEDEWIKTGGAWYYLNPTAEMATGWVQVDGIWYYCSASGAMQTGWKKINGSWYYLESSGAMATGWKNVDGTWYYLDATGAMQTGWVQVDGIWYYCNGSGAMQTGWLKAGGSWYYLNPSGAMATGWKSVGGTWYFLTPGNGAMKTGWIDDDGTWYYCNGSGAMQTGWLKTGGAWYYLKGSGAMATGWQKVGGIWYYLSDSGAMVTGTHVIDGASYTFDSSGAWTGSSVKVPEAKPEPEAEAPRANEASSAQVDAQVDAAEEAAETAAADQAKDAKPSVSVR